jgi:toxin ParE1/3/4
MAKDLGQARGDQSATMKVVWSRRAIRHVAKRILDSIDLLKSQPDMGRPGRVLGTRELVIPDTPYIIPYRVQRGRLELIAIFHGRQKWPPKL